jgi:NAD+ synthase (glutamine-hydrolysing)
MRAPPFEEGLYQAEFQRIDGKVRAMPAEIAPALTDAESVYRALVLGVRDYVGKHGFPGVVMGLSGGIDSALTLAIAVDALGKDKVHAVMMPSPYTSQMSLDDARGQAEAMGVKYSVLPIGEMMKATVGTLREEFAGREPDTAEENIQSRCRMVLLMGISNKTGKMLLTGVGPRLHRGFLSAPQLGRRNHLHGLGDLLGVAHRADPFTYDFEGCHNNRRFGLRVQGFGLTRNHKPETRN